MTRTTMPLQDQSARDAIASDFGTTYVVEAAAGTGKTSALVGRIVGLIAGGTTELELPLDGQDVSANDGDGGQKVCRSAKVNRDSVVITERFPNERQPYSECRRTLQPDGRMRIDVKKRTAAGHMVGMRAIAAKV